MEARALVLLVTRGISFRLRWPESLPPVLSAIRVLMCRLTRSILSANTEISILAWASHGTTKLFLGLLARISQHLRVPLVT
jgi:hypothetical protein